MVSLARQCRSLYWQIRRRTCSKSIRRKKPKHLNVRSNRKATSGSRSCRRIPTQRAMRRSAFRPRPSKRRSTRRAHIARSSRARSIKFEYDEKADDYIVSFGDTTFSGKLSGSDISRCPESLCGYDQPARAAQGGRAAAPAPKQRKRAIAQRQQGPGSADPTGDRARPEHHVRHRHKPGQLPPAVQEFGAWHDLNERLTRLENVMRDAITATAKALED